MPDLRKYGLTPADWEELLAFQGRRCPLCKRPFNLKRLAVVDHNHRSGHVRGALCSPCNHRLGLLHEDAGWFERAHKYLSNPIADTVFSRPRRHIDAPPEERTR